jgi:HlyD family secretion protein
VALVFETSGPVAEVLVKEGDYVVTGDLLAQLDSQDMELVLRDAQITRDLRQTVFDSLTAAPRDVDIEAAEAALTAAKASLNAAILTAPDDNALEIARLQTEVARNQLWQIQLQRDSTVDAFTLNPVRPDEFPEGVEIPQGVVNDVNDVIDQVNTQAVSENTGIIQLNSAVTQADYGVQIADAQYADTLNTGPDMSAVTSSNAAVVQAEVNLDRLLNGPSETELRLSEIDLQRAELTLEQAQVNLEATLLTAPFSGVIAQNNLKVGELAPVEAPAMLLMDTSGYHIDIPVDETDIVNVQVGQKVTITLDALPNTEITGTVTRVAVTPERVGQLVTYMVRVTLDRTTVPIRVGMSATARILVSELTDVMTLPNRFIRIERTTQQAYVTVQHEDGTYDEIEVILGLRNETHSQIVSGLAAGQRVVLLPRDTFNPITR